ncbi:hypothetical protein MMC17_001304 [Xylographa soralifera]|nr:hypothetical protein [Xylographa soralifera]
MNPLAGPQGQNVPSGPRQPDVLRRGGGGNYRKRKAWLEILPDAPPLPTRTHGNPFGFSNVPADHAIPLAFDHPLKEELAEVKRVRESRRSYWLQIAEELPDDMNNPGSYDHQMWKNEESLAEAKIEELAGLIALAERGITVERTGSPPVAIPVRDSARRGSDEGALNIDRNKRASSPPAIRSARESNPRGSHRGTLSTRGKKRASGAPHILSRQPDIRSKGKRKNRTRAQSATRMARMERMERSEAQQRNPHP